jgi:hypothetical protein
LVIVAKDGKIEGALKRRLKELGFEDTVDRLIVRTCLSTTDRRIVSDDSDFWDPADKNSTGMKDAPVSTCLWKEERIRVSTLGEFLSEHRNGDALKKKGRQ